MVDSLARRDMTRLLFPLSTLPLRWCLTFTADASERPSICYLCYLWVVTVEKKKQDLVVGCAGDTYPSPVGVFLAVAVVPPLLHSSADAVAAVHIGV